MRANLRFALCAFVLATAVACERGSSSGDPAVSTPTMTAPLGAPYFLDPTTKVPLAGTSITVDFGRVRLGSEVRRELLVSNRGAATFTVTVMERSKGLPDAFQVATSSFSVDAGREFTLLITFRPTTLGDLGGTLRLVIDNGDPAELAIALLGRGAESRSPELEVEPPQLNFGGVAVNVQQARPLVITHVGSDVPGTDADSLRFGVKGEGGIWEEKVPEIVGPDAAEFGLEWPPQGADAVAGLAEGKASELRVKFQPMTAAAMSATLVVYTNDPAQPRVEIPLRGRGVALPPCDFAVTPPLLTFGAVEASDARTLSFAIINLDSEPSHECLVSMLDLSAATKQTGAFALVDGPIMDSTIRGGESLVVPVRFQPSRKGTFSGELSFLTSNPARPEVTVRVDGLSPSDCLTMVPGVFDFGSVLENCRSRERRITMYNTCNGSIQIDAIGLQEGPSSEFAFSRRPALPLAIAGGASAEFGVTYQPRDAGTDIAAVSVAVHGIDGPFEVSVTGSAQLLEERTDIFTQSGMPKLDLLFVIDNSATMADKQASLTSNLNALFLSAVNSCVDYHIAITTTDVSASGEAGRFLPVTGSNPRVVTRSTPNALQVLAENAAVGTSGSETEALLNPAYLALSDPLINGHNAGFLRDGARLAVLIISDAADQDVQMSVAEYEYFFTTLRPRGMVTVSAVIPTQSQAPSGCSYDASNAGLDTRVTLVVQRTLGILEEICNPNWGGRFSLSQSCPGLRRTFFLTETPDMSGADPIQIEVDDVPLPQFDTNGARRWEYSHYTNSIEFEPLAAPPPGSTVVIRYQVAIWCL